MTLLGDSISHWCQEESLSVVVERDEESAVACIVSLSGDPPLPIAVHATGPQPARVTLRCNFELSLPAEMAADPEGPQRIATLLERVAASRSALVECRAVAQEGKLAAEVAVTLHADGISKQDFLAALEEVGKVVRVIGWEIEGMSVAADIVSGVRALAEQTGALTSELAQATAAPVEAQPVTPAPAPPPAPAAPAPAAAAESRFCPSCGRQAQQPQQRFCVGCGTPLEG